MDYFNKHKEGILLTTIFHLIVVLLLFYFKFFTPLPLPEDKGVLVDFGNSPVGMGKIEPKAQPSPVQAKPEPVKETTPPPTPKVTPTETTPNPSGKEEVMTQDFEKTVAVDEGKKKRDEEALKKKEEEDRKKKAADEQKRKEELAKQQKLEQEKLAKQVRDKQIADSLKRIEDARLAEARRIAEIRRQDSIRQAQEQAQIAAIDNRAKNAFSGSNNSNSSSTSTGQGATYQPGNQGSPTGTPGANTYAQGGGEGITFNLSGRSAINLPKPSYPGQEEGIVVVQVTVDRDGVVTKVEPGVKGSTSLDAGLLNAAKRAALSTRFNKNTNAPAYQVGTITYRFVLN